MGLSREETMTLVQRILAGDSNAFKEFQKEWGAIIVLHTKKWVHACAKVTRGMYDFKDVEQEIWEYIYKNLHRFDASKSTMVTWLYMMCPSRPGKIVRKYGNTINSPIKKTYNEEDDEYEYEGWMSSLNETVGGEDGDKINELLDFIVDPQYSIDNYVISEFEIYEYIYVLKDFIKRMTEEHRLVYMHMIMGLTQMESAAIIGCGQVRVSRARNKIQSIMLDFKDNYGTIETQKADHFAISLISSKTDDELSHELGYDIAVIKICREILSLANLYDKGNLKTLEVS